MRNLLFAALVFLAGLSQAPASGGFFPGLHFGALAKGTNLVPYTPFRDGTALAVGPCVSPGGGTQFAVGPYVSPNGVNPA